MIDTINRVMRATQLLVQDLGREPTVREIAERTGVPLAKVLKVSKIAQTPISLESPIGEDEDSRFGDFLEDRQANSPADAVFDLDLPGADRIGLEDADAERTGGRAAAFRPA